MMGTVPQGSTTVGTLSESVGGQLSESVGVCRSLSESVGVVGGQLSELCRTVGTGLRSDGEAALPRGCDVGTRTNSFASGRRTAWATRTSR